MTYSLDPLKGFLPVSCYGIWKNPIPGVVFSQYEMRFVVDDSKLVNGLWMPIKMRDAICPNGESKKGNLNITTVKEVKLARPRNLTSAWSFLKARILARLRSDRTCKHQIQPLKQNNSICLIQGGLKT